MTQSTPAPGTAGPSAAQLETLRAAHTHTDVGPDYRQLRVTVTGGELMVGLWGPEPGPGESVPTVLAVHGVSASHRSFGLLADALPGVRVIAPDLRGRGRSNHLPGPYGMPAHADDLAAVLRELRAGPVPVIGHSMGAFASLVLAHRDPELVSELILVDGGLPLAVPEGLTTEEVVTAVLGPAAERLSITFASIEDYREFWRAHPAFPQPWNALLQDYILYDLDAVDGGFRPATRYAAMAQDTAELVDGGSLLAALHELDTPARLLWSHGGLLGEEPGLYTAEYLNQWIRREPALQRRLRAELVEQTNHYSILMDQAGATRVAQAVRHVL